VIPYDAPDQHLPLELREQIDRAKAPIVEALRKRLNTPVPGNPYGGFPGIDAHGHRQTLRSIRTELIDKWNTEHPDYEYIVPEPLEKPLTQGEIEAKVREARFKPRMVRLDPAHEAHIGEVLKDHPEEHHEGLRELLKHETNTYGLKPQQHYWRRATTLDAIREKGLDPHNLMHRYQHHLETNGQENAERPDQS
jgi:hypothetical protein